MCSNRSLVQLTQTYCNYGLKDSQDTEPKQTTETQKASCEKCFITSIHTREKTPSTVGISGCQKEVLLHFINRVPVELSELLSELTELHYLGAAIKAECTNSFMLFHKLQGGGKTK